MQNNFIKHMTSVYHHGRQITWRERAYRKCRLGYRSKQGLKHVITENYVFYFSVNTYVVDTQELSQ